MCLRTSLYLFSAIKKKFQSVSITSLIELKSSNDVSHNFLWQFVLIEIQREPENDIANIDSL